MEHKHVARALEILGGIVIAAAAFAGFKFGEIHTVTTDTFGFTNTSDQFSWKIALGIWFSGAVSGFSLIGFASLINLLIELRDGVKDVLSETKKRTKAS